MFDDLVSVFSEMHKCGIMLALYALFWKEIIMIFTEIPFREIFAKPFVLKYDASKLFDGLDNISWPEEADAVLCYSYYDIELGERGSGLSLDILAPMQFDTGFVYQDMSPFLVGGARLLIRSGQYEACEVYCFAKESEDRIREAYATQCALDDSYWCCDKDVVELFNIEEIDHLRYLTNPLDVQVYLFGGSQGTELVWMQLIKKNEDGTFQARLLNMPYGLCGCVPGDVMQVSLFEGDDGVTGLFTRADADTE